MCHGVEIPARKRKQTQTPQQAEELDEDPSDALPKEQEMIAAIGQSHCLFWQLTSSTVIIRSGLGLGLGSG